MCKQLIVGLVLALGLTSMVCAEEIVIGNWEGGMDGWNKGPWEGSVFDGYSSIGATLGNTSLMVKNDHTNYWAMMSSPVAAGYDLTHGKFRIDASFRTNEWPSGDVWVMLDALAIQTSTDGVNWVDWRQVNATYPDSNGIYRPTGFQTVIDRNTGSIIPDYPDQYYLSKVWTPWDVYSDRTYVWDLDTLGIGPEATRYGVKVSVSILTNQTIAYSGETYLDNARFDNAQFVPEPATLLLLTLGGMLLRRRKYKTCISSHTPTSLF